MDELSDEFIRQVILIASRQTPAICKAVMMALADGDHLTIRDLLPKAFD